MRTKSLFIQHRVSLALAKQHNQRSSKRADAQLRALRKALIINPQYIVSLLEALSADHQRAKRSIELIRAIGIPAGNAIAIVLPSTIALIEAEPPQDSTSLRRADNLLCNAIALVEQIVPERLVDVYRAIDQQASATGRLPWWTFRPRQRLQEAFQRSQRRLTLQLT